MEGIQLRDYQQAAVNGLRDSYRRGRAAPLLVLPTGGGKTICFCHIAEAASAKGNNVMILVHREELLKQCSRSLDRLGVRHGLIASKCTFSHEQVQVASVQTLVRRMDKMRWEPDLIVIDEAHHAVAGSWRKVIDWYSDAKLLGVTATPERLDGKGLKDVFDDLIAGPSIADLTAMGHLCPTKVFAPPEPHDLGNVRTRGGDYDTGQLVAVMDSPSITGDAVEHYSRVCPGAPAIAFCVTVDHAKHVAEQFRRAGYRAESLDGTMDSTTRAQLIDDLGAGRLDVLTSCEIVSEGTDIPVVTAAILLRPTKSQGLFLQQVGRVLRPAPGKDYAIILDHAGNTKLHGLPADERDWSLEGRKKRKGDAALSITTCPNCFAAHHPAPKCPCCGFVYGGTGDKREVDELSGELVEVKHPFKPGDRIEVFQGSAWVSGYEFRGDAEDGKAWVAWAADTINARILSTEWVEPLERMRLDSRFQAVVKKKEQAKAQSLDELIALGQRRGYKNPVGWARHIYNARQQRAAASV